MVVSVSFCYYAPQSPQTPQPFLLLKIECRKKTDLYNPQNFKWGNYIDTIPYILVEKPNLKGNPRQSLACPQVHELNNITYNALLSPAQSGCGHLPSQHKAPSGKQKVVKLLSSCANHFWLTSDENRGALHRHAVAMLMMGRYLCSLKMTDQGGIAGRGMLIGRINKLIQIKK